MPTKDVPPIWVSCSTTRLFCRSAFFLIASLFVLSGCGSTTQVTTNTADQTRPRVFGDYIVWEDERNVGRDIYLYEISSGTETQITDEAASQWYPAISGDYVVWQDRRNGNWDIYMFDL